MARQHAAVLYSVISIIWFKENVSMILAYNEARLNGGALYIDQRSNVSFSEFARIIFHHNSASYGGVILANNHSDISVTGNTELFFLKMKLHVLAGLHISIKIAILCLKEMLQYGIVTTRLYLVELYA